MSKRKSTDGNLEDPNPKRSRSIDNPVPPSLKSATGVSLPAGFTFRISNIPKHITDDRFLQALNRLHRDTDLDQQQPNVLRWSIAPSAASADAEHHRTATATFRSVPLEFKPVSISMTINLFGNDVPAIVDTHFYGLTPLSNPSEPVVDIVAVTGLAGHAFGSWKSRGGYTMWLRDFLPQRVPAARILTYGYDSKLLGNNSNASIREYSKNLLEALQTARAGVEEQHRPIIFIGHSLGGIVIRYALLTAQTGGDGSEYIFSACHALLLFGVPHKGLKVESLRCMVKGQPNSCLINDLDEYSSFIDLLDQFWKSSKPNGIRIVSIYETKPTPTVEETPTGWKRTGPEALIVNRDSAICAMSDVSFSIDANHSDIVKFVDSSCPEYHKVRSRIISLVGDAHEKRGYVLFRGFNEEKKRKKILKWLSPIEYKKHHQNAEEGLLKDTGRWLRENTRFREWQSSEVSSILWLQGIPGAGKTKLACMIIQTMETQQNRGSHRNPEPVIYFYCNRDEPLRRDPTSIMQTIAKQLSLARPDFLGLPNPLVAEYTKRVQDGVAPGPLGFQESEQLVVSLLSMYHRATVIIDALDECDPKKLWQLLGALKRIIQSSACLVKMFLSSRDDIDIRLKPLEVPKVQIESTDSSGDIERFVHREVVSSIENGQMLDGRVTNQLKEQIISVIVAKAKGMFQWANLQIQYLCELKFEKEIQKNLGRLPQTLEAAYCQIYDVILAEEPYAQGIATKALMWVMCSRRQLTEGEWVDAIFWPEQAPVDSIRTLLKLCRNLVMRDKQSGVSFAHLSVREFLETKFTNIDANSMAAITCLSVFDPINSSAASQLNNGFFKYSSHFWPDHVKFSANGKLSMGTALLPVMKCFLGTTTKPGPAYCRWLEQLALENLVANRLRSTPPNPLFAASYLGFAEELQDLWECNSFDINCMNHSNETLLTVASRFGNEQVVNLLLRKGASVNKGGGYTNPLKEAIIADHGRIVVQLLEKGANCSTDVLELFAAERGGGSVMEVLLDQYPDIVFSGAVAITAARNRKKGKEVMEVLVDRNPNIKITEAVMLAAADNDSSGEKVMKVLLDRGRDIEITEAVILAAAGNYWRSTEIMQMLLDSDPDIEITEAVMVASAGNRCSGEEVMQVLLDRGRDIEITEEVILAAAGNHWMMMEMLLDSNRDIEINEEVMVAAARNRRTEMMQMLLDSDRDIEITEEAMVAAAGNSWSAREVMQMLLDWDRDIEITEAVMVAAADAACEDEFGKEVMEILLDSDCDIEITEAVIVAAARNYSKGTEIMQMLLDCDRDIKITEAVIVAAAGNYKCGKVMKMLLDWDRDIKITEAVMVAAVGKYNRDIEVMQMLLDWDRDIKITEAVMVAAAGKLYSGEKVMKVLLDRGRDIEITEAVMLAAAGNDVRGEDVMEMLLDWDRDIEITEAVMVAAAGNYNRVEVMQMLLDRGRDIDITKAVMSAAAGRNSSGVMKVLLDRGRDIEITEEVMVAAAGNHSCGEKVMKVLLDRGRDIEITEAIMVAALGNPSEGTKLMQMLLDQRRDFKITEAIMVAAVRKEIDSEGVIEMLLGRDPDIKITKEVLVEAARNGLRSRKSMSALLDKNPGIEVSKAALAATKDNKEIDKCLLCMLERYIISK